MKQPKRKASGAPRKTHNSVTTPEQSVGSNRAIRELEKLGRKYIEMGRDLSP